MAPQPAKTLHDVLILQGQDEVPAQLREMLRSKGYATHLADGPGKVSATLRKLSSPILFIYCGRNAETAASYRRFLLTERSLSDFAVLFVGPGSSAEDRQLVARYELLMIMDANASHGELIDALGRLGEVANQSRLEAAEAAPAAAPPAPSEVEAIERIEPPLSPYELYAQFPKIPELVFELLQQLEMIDTLLGGEFYPRFHDVKKVEESGISETKSPYASHITPLLTKVGRWGKAHLYRTAYMVDRLGAALKLSDQARQTLRDAAFLFGTGFTEEKKRDLIRVNYMRALPLRKNVAACVAASAAHASSGIKNQEISSILQLAGRLISNEPPSEESDQMVPASLLMACELADRICFQSEYWDTRAAYQLVRKMKEITFGEVHPHVLAVLLKYISEAVMLGAPAMLLPKRMRTDPQILAEAERRQSEPVGPNEMKVPLTQLMAGMMLSRPLVAFDGRMILEANMRLDRDLIWRLWQLSAIRPLNGPIVIYTEEPAGAGTERPAKPGDR